jgi:hypothetical protein
MAALLATRPLAAPPPLPPRATGLLALLQEDSVQLQVRPRARAPSAAMPCRERELGGSGRPLPASPRARNGSTID